MQKIILTTDQIQELVSRNRYPVDPSKKFLSRCIDGRYKNEEDLQALAFPGADVGELALLLAMANVYGCKIDLEKASKCLIELVGGEKNFSMHTDHHGDKNKTASGCGHFQQINLNPKAYSLKKDQLNAIQKKIDDFKRKKTPEIVLEGEHLEGAVLIVSGNFGVFPRFKFKTERAVEEVEVFVYHQTLVDARHKALAKKLFDDNAVELVQGCDAEYLYEVLSETAENHMMETVKRLAKDLPIYQVNFKNDGSFDILEMGNV